MKKIILVCIIIFPSMLYANTCSVAKNGIKVADVSLGDSINDLARKHKAIEVDNKIINRMSDKDFLVFINQKYKNEWLYGEPIESFNFITYDKKSYKIKSFGVTFGFDNFTPDKFKQTLIMLYGLPKKGWIYSKISDPKYGEAVEYNYKCNEYKIRISQSALGSSMQISGN